MKPVGSKDIYEAKALSLISSGDLDIVIDLYLPVIGSFAFSIYAALATQSREKIKGHLEHGPLFAKLQLTSGQFFKGVEALEAVGLVKTYYKTERNTNTFIYGLYAPKDPASFFGDPLLLGTLRKYLGETEVASIHEKYKVESEPIGFEDISCGFGEFFHPDFSDPVFGEPILRGIPHQPGKIATSFDFAEFHKELKETGIQLKLSKKDLEIIEKYASLYNISAKEMAYNVADCRDYAGVNNGRIDYARLSTKCMVDVKYHPSTANPGLQSQVSSESLLASHIKMMDEKSPVDYLASLQNFHKPSKADLKLIDVMAIQMGLPFPAINAIIDYVLEKNDNILSAPYCEKLAAFLVREGVKTARDAMDSLNRSRVKYKPQSSTHSQIEPEPDDISDETEADNDSAEVDMLLEKVFGDK